MVRYVYVTKTVKETGKGCGVARDEAESDIILFQLINFEINRSNKREVTF